MIGESISSVMFIGNNTCFIASLLSVKNLNLLTTVTDDDVMEL